VARIARAKRVDPVRADGYAELGRRLLLAGRAILDDRDSRHASGLVVLGIHSAIAFSDALCVRFGGRKSTSADHAEAVKLLRATLGARLPAEMEKLLGRVLSEKDRFEYQGYVATMREAETLFSKAERFGAWAELVLTSDV
jgi:hypothetical protein